MSAWRRPSPFAPTTAKTSKQTNKNFEKQDKTPPTQAENGVITSPLLPSSCHYFLFFGCLFVFSSSPTIKTWFSSAATYWPFYAFKLFWDLFSFFCFLFQKFPVLILSFCQCFLSFFIFHFFSTIFGACDLIWICNSFWWFFLISRRDQGPGGLCVYEKLKIHCEKDVMAAFI